MMEPLTGWCFGLVASLLMGAGAAWFRGGELGLGVAVVCSFVFPTWLHVDIAGLHLGVRTAVASLALGAYAIRFPRRIPSRLTILDGLLAALVASHTASDLFNERNWLTPLRVYGEWAIPYLAARFAMRDGTSFNFLARFVAGVIVVLSIGGMIECLTSINPWEFAFGVRTGDFPRTAARLGFKRAYGNTIHPIFFGLELLALFPWPLTLVSRESSRRWQAAAALAGLIVLGGCASTISRGPLLAFVGVFWIALMIRYVWARWLLGGISLAVGLLIAWNPIQLFYTIGSVIGEKTRTTELNGEQVEINGALNRYWLVTAYAPALQEAGLFGYGTRAVESFPVNVPKLPAKAKTIDDLRWVDNAYVLTGLRLGWMGVSLLTLFLLATAATGLIWSTDPNWSSFGLWTSASVAAMMAALLSVWMSYDFGFAMLWTSGTMGGLAAWRTRRRVRPSSYARELPSPRPIVSPTGSATGL